MTNVLSPEEYERKLSQLDHKRPWNNRFATPTRIISWSDPKSARAGEESSLQDISDRERSRYRTESTLGGGESGAEYGYGWQESDSSGSQAAVVQRPGVLPRYDVFLCWESRMLTDVWWIGDGAGRTRVVIAACTYCRLSTCGLTLSSVDGSSS